KYMAKRGGPSGQTWGHLSAQLCAAHRGDEIICGSIALLARREPIWIDVTSHPTAEWVARPINEAFFWNEPPRYLIRDQDVIYGPAVARRLRARGIRDKPIAPGSPWQNGYAERLIGKIRRECLDHVIVLGDAHLRRILGGVCRLLQ